MVGGNNDKWPLFRGFGSWKFQRGGGGGGGGSGEYSGLRRGGRGSDLNGGEITTESTNHLPGSSSFKSSHTTTSRTEGLILRVPTGSACQSYGQNDGGHKYFGNYYARHSNEFTHLLPNNGSNLSLNHINDDSHGQHPQLSDDDESPPNDQDLYFDGLNNSTDNTESGSLTGIYNNQQRERHYKERQRRLQQGRGEEDSQNLATTSEIYTTSTAATPSLIDSNKSKDQWYNSKKHKTGNTLKARTTFLNKKI